MGLRMSVLQNTLNENSFLFVGRTTDIHVRHWQFKNIGNNFENKAASRATSLCHRHCGQWTCWLISSSARSRSLHARWQTLPLHCILQNVQHWLVLFTFLKREAMYRGILEAAVPKNVKGKGYKCIFQKVDKERENKTWITSECRCLWSPGGILVCSHPLWRKLTAWIQWRISAPIAGTNTSCYVNGLQLPTNSSIKFSRLLWALFTDEKLIEFWGGGSVMFWAEKNTRPPQKKGDRPRIYPQFLVWNARGLHSKIAQHLETLVLGKADIESSQLLTWHSLCAPFRLKQLGYSHAISAEGTLDSDWLSPSESECNSIWWWGSSFLARSR